ncbi:glycosyltransferase family 2 protein [Ideonella sp. DXS29W]|uniref:Glycosyltransferase family 2 protein n=1 Tax=Ideonella lacteola TaxID=2984193 RepID=A0ABU9BTE4_9BURK
MSTPTLTPPATAVDLPAARLQALAQLKPHRLSVVVPMYNEIDNARPLIDAVQAALAAYPCPWELIVVDDGSRDGTGRALQDHAATVGPHIRVLRLLRNFRQTAAMQAGIDAARGDVIVTMDGDLQNDPQDIPLLVAKLLNEPYDLVAGWRQNRQDGFALRKFPSMLANRLIRRVTDLKFQDLGCSLKAFRAPVLREIRLYGEMHRFIPAWLATVTSPSRMAEVPVSHHARTAGESKYGISRTFRVLVDLLAVYFFLNFGARPGHFFGTVGLGIGAMGTMILSYLGVLKLLGESVGGRPLLILGFFMVIAGLQFLCTGVLAELLIRIYYEGGHARQYHTMHQPPLDDADAWHEMSAGGR